MRKMAFKEKTDAINALNRAAAHIGSVLALADALGVSRRSVYNWKELGVIPAEHAISLDRLTEGVVKASDMRPDLFGGDS